MKFWEALEEFNDVAMPVVSLALAVALFFEDAAGLGGAAACVLAVMAMRDMDRGPR